MPSSRREFFSLLALAVAGVSLGVGCGRRGPSAEEIARQAASYPGDLQCVDVTGLWPAEIKTRQDNDYHDRSVKPIEFCFNCSNFEQPDTPGRCGSCRTVKGPINPLGWCTAWTELQT